MFVAATMEKRCWTAAIILHAFLLLWKAGEFKLPEYNYDPIVNVSYLEEDPMMGLAQFRGAPKKEEKIFEKLKNFFSFKSKPKAKPAETLMGADSSMKIDSKIKIKEQISKPKLKNRAGKVKDTSFDAGKLGKTGQDLVSTSRRGPDINTTRTLPSSLAEAKLENKEYKIAFTKTPFEIASAKSSDQSLAGGKVYVPTGKTTSRSVRNLSSEVTQGLEGSGALVDKGVLGGGLSGTGGAGSIDSGVARASSSSGGSLSGVEGGTGSGKVYRGSGRGRSGSGSAGDFSSLTGGSRAGSQSISDSGSTDSKGSGGGSKALFEITGQLAGRKIIRKKIPVYPEWAMKEGLKARVRLRFEVLSNGKVKTNIIVQQTSGYVRLDKLTINALLEWLFVPLPAKDYGKTQWGVILFKFDIK